MLIYMIQINISTFRPDCLILYFCSKCFKAEVMNQDYNCVDVKTSRRLGVLSQCSRHDATILHFTRFRIPLNAALVPYPLNVPGS